MGHAVLMVAVRVPGRGLPVHCDLLQPVAVLEVGGWNRLGAVDLGQAGEVGGGQGAEGNLTDFCHLSLRRNGRT